ncbi:hypothetical protein ACI78V_09580 [Geodermatophilus sp. SYSU D00742]
MTRGRRGLRLVRERLGSLLRHGPGTPVAPADPDRAPELPGFRIGPLRTGYVGVDGDGSRVIPEENVSVTVDPTDVELPADLRAWRAEAGAALEAAGRWNGARYAVVTCSAGRSGDREEPVLRIRLRHSDYLNFRTTQQVDRPFDDGTTPRSRYLAGRSLREMPDFMANSLGAHVAVVTADDLLVVSRRSEGVAVQPGLWSAAVSEGLSRGMDGAPDAPPSIYGLARRGMDEELAVDEHEYSLELLSVGLATTVHQWVALFVARLHSLTWDQLSDRLSRGSADPWEHSEHDTVEFAPGPVLAMVLDPARRDSWTPASVPAFYYALVRRWGRAGVERAVEELTRARPPTA